MSLTGYAPLFVSQWLAVIGAFRLYLVPLVNCIQCRPALCCSPEMFPLQSPVVFLDHGYSHFMNFESIIPVDIIRVKSCVNTL